MLIVQFFVLHVVVEAVWTEPYSWAGNAVSDLGNTQTSPWHAAMNVSFVLLGICMAVGAVLLVWMATKPGAVLIVLSGIGTVLVGLFPENVDIRPHAVGALSAFLFGNLGIVLVGRAVHRRFTVVCGALGLIGLALVLLLLTGVLGGKDVWGGAAERLTIFPLLIAMIVTGGVALARPIRA